MKQIKTIIYIRNCFKIKQKKKIVSNTHPSAIYAISDPTYHFGWKCIFFWNIHICFFVFEFLMWDAQGSRKEGMVYVIFSYFFDVNLYGLHYPGTKKRGIRNFQVAGTSNSSRNGHTEYRTPNKYIDYTCTINVRHGPRRPTYNLSSSASCCLPCTTTYHTGFEIFFSVFLFYFLFLLSFHLSHSWTVFLDWEIWFPGLLWRFLWETSKSKVIFGKYVWWVFVKIC